MCVLRVLWKETMLKSMAILKHRNYLYQRTLAASIDIWFFSFAHLSPSVRPGETEEVLKMEALRWGSWKRPATDVLCLHRLVAAKQCGEHTRAVGFATK